MKQYTIATGIPYAVWWGLKMSSQTLWMRHEMFKGALTDASFMISINSQIIKHFSRFRA